MIDESINNTKALTSLKSSISEQRLDIAEIKRELLRISEKDRDILRGIKERLESDEDRIERKAFYNKVDRFVDYVKNPKTWIALLVSAIIAIAAIVGSVITFTNLVSFSNDQTKSP